MTKHFGENDFEKRTSCVFLNKLGFFL